MATASATVGLTDSDILIDALRGLQDAIAFLSSQQRTTGLRISVISSMELIQGCANKKELQQIQRFLQRATVLPVTDGASLTACQCMEKHYLSHALEIPDALIAGTALTNGLTLFTRNVKHFKMISGLNIVSPY